MKNAFWFAPIFAVCTACNVPVEVSSSNVEETPASDDPTQQDLETRNAPAASADAQAPKPPEPPKKDKDTKDDKGDTVDAAAGTPPAASCKLVETDCPTSVAEACCIGCRDEGRRARCSAVVGCVCEDP